MTIKMSLAIPGGAIEISAANQKELIKEASFWQQLPHTCPVCGTETRLYFKEPNDFQYFGLICTNPAWPKHEMNCGQHKEGGTLYVKDAWQYYDPEQQRAIVVWENGRPTNRGADAQPQQMNGKPNAPHQSAPPEPPPVEHSEPPPEGEQDDNPFNGPPVAARSLLNQFHKLGSDLYGDKWEDVRHHNVDRITGGKTTSSNDLTTEQAEKLIEGLKSLQRKRRGVQQKVTA